MSDEELGNLGYSTLEAPTVNIRDETAEREPVADRRYLVQIVGSSVGRTHLVDEEVYIGRDPKCEIWIPDRFASRKHARILRRGVDEYVIEDLGSRNGTRVNGNRVKEYVLQPDDVVGISDGTVFLFTRRDPMPDQVVQLQKMEAIGQLAAGVAHDFNNILEIVSLNASYLSYLRDLDLKTIESCAAELIKAADRGAKLIRQLLDFARLGDYNPCPMDLSTLVADLISFCERSFQTSVQIRSAIEPGLVVNGDRAQLYHALMNLMINARDAMPEGGRLLIQLIKAEPGQGGLGGLELSDPGPHAVVEVQDTGEGIDPDIMDRVFEPFFSTKPAGKGTGLGLSMAMGIVKQHKGQIDLWSNAGQGTTFQVVLPLCRSRPETPRDQPRPPTTEMESVKATILLVDDDDLVLQTTARLLESLGHKVLTASSGNEAVQVFDRERHQIDVVVMDVVMPNLGGREAFLLLRKIDPEVKVLFISGYGTSEDRETLVEAGVCGVLTKPLNGDDLMKAIRDAVLG
jgi:signal transduction histidine kinase/ActR/RegA family two-component response regulator